MITAKLQYKWSAPKIVEKAAAGELAPHLKPFDMKRSSVYTIVKHHERRHGTLPVSELAQREDGPAELRQRALTLLEDHLDRLAKAKTLNVEATERWAKAVQQVERIGKSRTAPKPPTSHNGSGNAHNAQGATDPLADIAKRLQGQEQTSRVPAAASTSGPQST